MMRLFAPLAGHMDCIALSWLFRISLGGLSIELYPSLATNVIWVQPPKVSTTQFAVVALPRSPQTALSIGS